MDSKTVLQQVTVIWQIVISGFVLVFPAIPSRPETICVPNCLHPSSNREPILANTSPGFRCNSGLWLLKATQNSCFACTPDWQWLQQDIFFSAGTGCIRCGACSPQWVWLLQVWDYTCSRECVCLRTICASSIRCNSVDNVWFLSGKLKRHLCPEDMGLIVYTPGNIGCLHFTKLR